MRDRIEEWVRRAGASLPGRCVRRFLTIEGTNRSLVLGSQAFTMMVPLLIIVASATATTEGGSLGDQLVTRWRLTGDSAAAVRTLFSRPPSATGVLSVTSLVLLLSALFSLTSVLQRTYEAAWQLPRRGLPGTLSGLTGTSVLFVQLIVLTLFASVLRGVHTMPVLAGVLRFLLGIPLWLALQYLLLSRRVPARALLPGAVVASAGQLTASLYSAVYIPRLIARDAERYGLIGVTFALISWLIVLAFAVVAGAVVSAELGRRAHPSRAIPVGPRAPSLRATVGTEGSGDGGPGGARLPEQGAGRTGDGGGRSAT
jgi:membrane protein